MKQIKAMKTKKLFPWLMSLMLLTTATPTFTACSDDDDSKDNNGTEQTDSLTAKYNDLDIFQEAICNIDSAGQLVRYEVGQVLYESEPQHLFIGVDDIEEAAKMFRTWIAPDVKLPEITASVGDLTAELTDTLGHAQGTIYFRKGSGTTVAEVTASADAKLKYVDRITFLLSSAWPYNSEALVWRKGDIRTFRITGKAGEELEDQDKELPFVLVREGKNGNKPMWVALTKNVYTPSGFRWDTDDFEKIRRSDYCPGESKAQIISQIMRSDWNFFKGRFSEAQNLGGGELRDDGSYWYDHRHSSGLINYWDMIMLSNGWTHGGNEEKEQFLLKIDWIDDDQILLRGTDGTIIKDGSFANVSGHYDNLFDGNENTMWETNHLWWESQSNPLYFVEFESAEPITPKSYAMVTGNINQWPTDNQNPRNWKLYGKLKARNNWTLLSERSGENLPFDSYKTVNYTIENAGGAYQYFRLEITDNRPWLKLADFKLFE